MFSLAVEQFLRRPSGTICAVAGAQSKIKIDCVWDAIINGLRTPFGGCTPWFCA
jgi:hypothetical protein